MNQKGKLVKPKVDTSWMQPKKMVWIENPTAKQIFTPAILESFDLKNAKLTMEDGSQQQKELHFLYERGEPNDFDDMVDMEVINDAELLVNLNKRYTKNLIFTYCGPTLLVVNPFKGIPELVSKECKDSYVQYVVNKENRRNKPPHIYAIGAEAYKCLFENSRNQAIVISGESGAGKTENAKLCMNLLTAIKFPSKSQRNSDDGNAMNKHYIPIEQKIMSCNPILESFGNAKTVRNNNSSRFGKYTKIYIAKDEMKIKGAEIYNYLLEKSRLCLQGKGERNFHIFYHLLKGMPPADLEKLYLAKGGKVIPFSEFTYLNTVSDVDGINDVQLYEEIIESIETLGLSEDKDNLFKLIAAVIHLGDLQIDESTKTDDTPCSIINQDKVKMISELLQMSPEQVCGALTLKQIEAQKKIIISPISKMNCLQNRDSWAKEMYERVFNYLVTQLNQTIVPNQPYASTVGLLDIYGFEVFDKNGFEQLMINYTNEKLHQLYISYVFKGELLVFKDEGLGKFCENIQFTDNQQIIETLDKFPTGVFDLLDETCQVKGEDDSFLQKIRKTHKDPRLVLQPKMPSNPSFLIVHTAKEVEYCVQGFTEKNIDEISALTAQHCADCGNELVAKLFKKVEQVQTGKKDKSLSKKIRAQMTELMKELNSCDVHFVRCIKPNDVKKPLILEQDYTLSQIRYLGVLDSLKVRKQNYPIRRFHQAFYKEFGEITNNPFYGELEKQGADFKQLVEQLFKDFYPELGPDQVLFGTSKIFVRLEGMIIFQEKYQLIMSKKHQIINKMQHYWHRYLLIQNVQRIKYLLIRIRVRIRCIRRRIERKKEEIAANLRKLALYRIQMGTIATYFNRYQINTKQDISPLFNLTKTQNLSLKFNANVDCICLGRKYKRIILNNSWQQIRIVNAIFIQKNIRGFLCRIANKEKLIQINQAKEDCIAKIKAEQALKLLRHQSAFKIQGYIKMKWLSNTFYLIRKNIRSIQNLGRRYLIKQSAKKDKFIQFQQPLEQQYMNQKRIEEGGLYSQMCDQGISYMSASILLDNDTIQDYSIQGFNEILQYDRDPQKVNEKASLFNFIIDLELLVDNSDFYYPSFSVNYKSLFQYGFTSGNSLQTLQVGDIHSIAATCTSKLYSWGMNNEGQLGIDQLCGNPLKPTLINCQFLPEQIACTDYSTYVKTSEGQLIMWGYGSEGISVVDVPNVKMIECNSSQTYIVTEQQELYKWGQNQQIEKIQCQQPIVMVSAGLNFIGFLTSCGQAYMMGSNEHGQLGQGDCIDRKQAILLKYQYKLSQLSCGLKHVISRTSLGKVLVWGWNKHGQLGLEDYIDRNEINQIYISNVNQVMAGRTSSVVLIENKQIQWCGSNASIQYSHKFIPVNLKAKASILQQSNYSPIRLMSSYSKTISTIQCTFINQNNVWKGSLSVAKSCLQTLTQRWLECNINSIDPPYIETLSKHMLQDHMKKNRGTVKRISVNKTAGIQIRIPQRISLNTPRHSEKGNRVSLVSEKGFIVDESIIEQKSNKFADIKIRIQSLRETPENEWSQDDKSFMLLISTQDISQLLDG